MRLLHYLPILALPLAACESDTEVRGGIVQWMEWPAEVRANTPFNVQLVIAEPGDCGQQSTYRPRVFADQSAVTFSPYFIVEPPRPTCAAARAYYPPTGMLVIGALETVGIAPGLRASLARVFEMRGASSAYALPMSTAEVGGQPVRTFGSFTVRPDAPVDTRQFAAGFVAKLLDTSCARIIPIGVYHLDGAYVLEDQADTAGLRGAFVRGYIYQPPGPVCGESQRVFHLVARY